MSTFLDLQATFYALMTLMVRDPHLLRFLTAADLGLVDICITTSWQQLEDVCMIAALLARSESAFSA